jgi:membrane protein DedA with SNARE-associated domain
MNISGLIATYGYWAVFALVAAESLGIPLPGETALIIAAAYAGHTHHLSGWALFAVASAAAVTGDNIGFWLGHKGGYRLARRYGAKVRVDERKLKIARYLFDTHGPKVVFCGRFISVVRIYAAFLAGISRMRRRRFLVANAAGAIAWAGAYTLAAYLAGTALQQASATIGWGLLGIGLAATLAAALLVRRYAGTLADRAEAAYPGPLDPAIPHGGDTRRYSPVSCPGSARPIVRAATAEGTCPMPGVRPGP